MKILSLYHEGPCSPICPAVLLRSFQILPTFSHVLKCCCHRDHSVWGAWAKKQLQQDWGTDSGRCQEQKRANINDSECESCEHYITGKITEVKVSYSIRGLQLGGWGKGVLPSWKVSGPSLFWHCLSWSLHISTTKQSPRELKHSKAGKHFLIQAWWFWIEVAGYVSRNGKIIPMYIETHQIIMSPQKRYPKWSPYSTKIGEFFRERTWYSDYLNQDSFVRTTPGYVMVMRPGEEFVWSQAFQQS